MIAGRSRIEFPEVTHRRNSPEPPDSSQPRDQGGYPPTPTRAGSRSRSRASGTNRNHRKIANPANTAHSRAKNTLSQFSSGPRAGGGDTIPIRLEGGTRAVTYPK